MAKAAAKVQKLETTRIDIDHNKRTKVVGLFNQLLADASDMTMRTKHAHWNVKGPHFIALHKYFDELYGVLGEHVDQIAERTAALGGFVKGRLNDAASASRLPAFPDNVQDGMDVVRAVADALGQFSNSVRDGIDECDELEDAVSADTLTQISSDLDKHLWFLEAHLR